MQPASYVSKTPSNSTHTASATSTQHPPSLPMKGHAKSTIQPVSVANMVQVGAATLQQLFAPASIAVQKQHPNAISFPNGDVYIGPVVNGLPHGKGEMVYGTRSDSNDSPKRYVGDFVNGACQGTGIMYYVDGSVYNGEFVNNQRHGTGKMDWPNGNWYDGMYVEGKRQGKGVKKSDDCIYTGDFLDDKRHGKGIITKPDGNSYEGDLLNGEITGSGIYKNASGVYTGQFLNGKFHGEGVRKYSHQTGESISWITETGTFNNGEFWNGTEECSSRTWANVYKNGKVVQSYNCTLV